MSPGSSNKVKDFGLHDVSKWSDSIAFLSQQLIIKNIFGTGCYSLDIGYISFHKQPIVLTTLSQGTELLGNRIAVSKLTIWKRVPLRGSVGENQAGCESSPSHFFQISMKYGVHSLSERLKTSPSQVSMLLLGASFIILNKNYGEMPYAALHLYWILPGNSVHILLWKCMA